MKHIIYTSNREAILMDAMAERETLVVVQNEKVAAYYLRSCPGPGPAGTAITLMSS